MFISTVPQKPNIWNKILVHLSQYKAKLGFSEHNQFHTELHKRIAHSTSLTLYDLRDHEDHNARKMV